MGQTLCQVISDPNFRPRVRGEGQNFNNREELLAYCMDDVNVLRQACCAFWNLFLKLIKMDHFRQAITLSSI